MSRETTPVTDGQLSPRPRRLLGPQQLCEKPAHRRMGILPVLLSTCSLNLSQSETAGRQRRWSWLRRTTSRRGSVMRRSAVATGSDAHCYRTGVVCAIGRGLSDGPQPAAWLAPHPIANAARCSVKSARPFAGATWTHDDAAGSSATEVLRGARQGAGLPVGNGQRPPPTMELGDGSRSVVGMDAISPISGGSNEGACCWCEVGVCCAHDGESCGV